MTTRRNVVTALAAIVTIAPASVALAAGGASTTGSDLQVSGSASTGSPATGAPYSYSFLVKNSGPDTATSVVVSDPLPAGTVYNFATANGSTLPCAAFGNLNGGATATCSLGNMAKGGQATIVINVSAPQTAGTYSNTGTATSTSTDPVATNNSATVSVQAKAAAGGGGGGAGGGGVNKGGVNDPTVTAVATPCATLGSISAPVGYYSVWAAIWNTFSLKSCSTGTESVNVEVTETNVATGTVDYDLIYPFSLLAAQNTSMVLDNDFAPFSTTYNITMTATDASGNVLSTGSVLATTPPPQ